MVKVSTIVMRNKAEKIFRFINYLIDLIASIMVIWLLIIIYAILKYLILGTTLEESGNDLVNINPLLDRILTILMYAFIMFITEKLTNGRSLGKLITGTKVVKIDGTEITTEDLLKRNFSRAVPFDMISFFGNNGWHDSWSDTRVVSIKSFERALKLEKEMDIIGTQEII